MTASLAITAAALEGGDRCIFFFCGALPGTASDGPVLAGSIATAIDPCSNVMVAGAGERSQPSPCFTAVTPPFQ